MPAAEPLNVSPLKVIACEPVTVAAVPVVAPTVTPWKVRPELLETFRFVSTASCVGSAEVMVTAVANCMPLMAAAS